MPLETPSDLASYLSPGLSPGPASRPEQPRLCPTCYATPPAYTRLRAVFHYRPPVSYLIQRLKFQRDLSCARMLANCLLTRFVSNGRQPQVDCVVPVPLSRQRQRQRGFNQAVELARPVARALRVPLVTDWVIRHRHTPEQSRLSRRQRQQNLHNAFAIRRPHAFTSVLLIDDVATTTATVSEISNLLLTRGVQHIEIWCCARTGR